MNDTIFALASAHGKAGVAVFRISGKSAFEIASRMCKNLPGNRGLRLLTDAEGTALDQALVLVFPEGASFTGEPVVEFHCHGSLAVIESISNALSSVGARLAEPGEFTRRALENDCMDLSQVEGLSDLIEAETEAQRKQALSLMEGGLSKKVEVWRKDLIRAAALIEATIDFADEEVPVDVTPEVNDLIQSVSSELKTEIEGSVIGERIRNGFEVAIVGPPNIGKSTLLNALAGRDAAITSEIAGTTRDVIEVRMDLAGIPVTLLDTAGLRDTDDVVEAMGVQLAKTRAEKADLRVFLTEDLTKCEFGIEICPDDIVLKGKADQVEENGISGKTNAGVDEMIQRVVSVLGDRMAIAQSAVRQRHKVAMEQAVDAIRKAESLLRNEDEAEFIALALNSALHSMNSLIGQVGVEDLLDEIFASFCIGK